MIRSSVAVAFLLSTCAVLAGCTSAPPGDTPKAGERLVRVAAASDLKFALDELIAEFHREHAGTRVQPTYGSSGNFYAQLTNRAPFDLFLSADMDYPRKLIEQGVGEPNSAFLYAVGHLVVWVPKDSALPVEKAGVKALLDPSVKKVAVANPRFAPYGRAAEAALKGLGVYDQLRERLVYGDNVAQASQFVQSGAADAGVIALSLALSPPMRDAGRYWQVPLDSHPPLEQGGVILSWAQDRKAAEAFRAFLAGARGKEMLRRYGFSLPDG